MNGWLDTWRAGECRNPRCRRHGNLCVSFRMSPCGLGSGGSRTPTNQRDLGIRQPMRCVCRSCSKRWSLPRGSESLPASLPLIGPIGCGGLEVPDYAAADEIVVLASLARVGQGQIGCARPEVADLAANAEAAQDPNVEPEAALEHT